MPGMIASADARAWRLCEPHRPGSGFGPPDGTQSTFQITLWDEKRSRELPDGGHLSRALVTQSYRGAMTGKSAVEYVMVHRLDQTATFVGIEHFSGTIHGRTGTCLFQHAGSFQGRAAISRWSVIPESGTDGLKGIGGHGSFVVGLHGDATVIFEPAFDEDG
ncbi:DUF3224 domain-containing protein [Chitinolyticbacter meiyuanensis]|uniref:DUF3224 domain-containing protein n=1 Tax=Chitinolyticbacter meiyuanensis TaxID=682798 RepID=UPI0011E5F59F|nr:DUF3224 domain-containing protein [Chitinolyticbacter meiyuanensis]